MIFMVRACLPTYLRPPKRGLRVGGSLGAGRGALRAWGISLYLQDVMFVGFVKKPILVILNGVKDLELFDLVRFFASLRMTGL
jgi:hypothetical protein